MSYKSLYLAPLVAALPLWLMPQLAIADPSEPVAGDEGPGQTINDLKSQGYNVQINWVAGQPSNIPLSQCVVTSIDTSAPPDAYVAINCPPDGSQ